MNEVVRVGLHLGLRLRVGRESLEDPVLFAVDCQNYDAEDVTEKTTALLTHFLSE